jgi:hypothetical protein
MKINEIASGKKVYVFMSMGEEHGRISDVSIEGIFYSEKEAERALAKTWFDNGDAFADQVDFSTLKTYLNSPKFDFETFQSMSEQIGEETGYAGPSLEDYLDYVYIGEATLK